MGVNSLPKPVTRQRRGCDLNPGPSAPESSTLTTRLPSQHEYMPFRVAYSWPLCANITSAATLKAHAYYNAARGDRTTTIDVTKDEDALPPCEYL